MDTNDALEKQLDVSASLIMTLSLLMVLGNYLMRMIYLLFRKKDHKRLNLRIFCMMKMVEIVCWIWVSLFLLKQTRNRSLPQFFQFMLMVA